MNTDLRLQRNNEEGGEFVEKPLTHVELSDKTGHVVVLKKLWQNLFCKPLFIQYKETVPFLLREIKNLVHKRNNKKSN